MKTPLLGLLLLGIAIVLTGTVLFFISCRGEKLKQANYERKYSMLNFLIDYGIDDHITCKNMHQMFAEIADDKYCNREKCQILEQKFYSKFKNAKA